MTGLVVGIDIGGSGTKACLTRDGRIVADVVVPTKLDAGRTVGDLALAALDEALDSQQARRDEVSAVGVGVPGQVDKGWVRHAANLGISAEGFDLGGHVSSATQVPAVVENDMRVAAYGAYLLSQAAGLPLRDLVYVGIGTGISAGVVLDGVIHRGSQGLAGEFGHVPMGTGIPCACGSVGCLETVIGSGGLRQHRTGEGEEDLFAAATRGEPEAVERADRAIDHLAGGMWWLAAAYDPDLFYIGGGVGAGSPFVAERLAARWAELAGGSELARRVLDPRRIKRYDLDEPVGAFGAARLAADLPGTAR